MFPFDVGRRSALPLVTTAIHAGHELRSEVADRISLDEATRLREEDPHTDRLTSIGGVPVVAQRSRFEVDLNRPREHAVYTKPDEAWGLDVWHEPLPDAMVEGSLAVYDQFYETMRRLLDGLALLGPFLVLDLHSYNHRRDGAGAPAADPEGNPEVNVGTGSLDRDHWEPVVSRFMDSLAAEVVAGHQLDVRDNVRFQGGHFSRWVQERYDGVGCALAIELKKSFMDEWTGVVDEAHLADLHEALAAAVPLTLGELACGVG